MTERTNPETVAWINKVVQEEAAKSQFPGSSKETELIEHWRYYRPRMVCGLEAAGPEMVEKLAFVLETMCEKSRRRYIEAGMPPPDANLEATKEWLLMGPEEEEEEEEDWNG